jgi:hypothetical protein
MLVVPLSFKGVQQCSLVTRFERGNVVQKRFIIR